MQIDRDLRAPGGEVRSLNPSGGGGGTRQFDTVQWLRTMLVIPVPAGEGSGQRPRAVHLDGSAAQGVAPLDLAEVPAGERHGIVDHDDQIFLAARVFLAISASPRSINSQLRLPGPDNVG